MTAVSDAPALPPPVLDALLQRAPVNVFLFDTDLICRYAAPVGDAFLGRTREQVIGQHAAQVLPPANEELRPILEQAAREAKPWKAREYRFTVRRDQEESHHCWAIEVEPMTVQSERRIMVALSDLDELIEERDRLRLEVDALYHQDEERVRQMSALLKDLRNLLTPAMGYMQVLVRRPQVLRGESPVAVVAERVLPRINRVVEALDQLQDVSSPRRGWRRG